MSEQHHEQIQPEHNPFASPLAPLQESSVTLAHGLEWLELRRALSVSHVWLYLLALGMFAFGLTFVFSSGRALVFPGTSRSAELYFPNVLHIASGVLLIASAVLTFFWAMAVGRFRSRPSTDRMEQMLLAQVRFWQVSALGTLPIALLNSAWDIFHSW